MTTSRNAPEDFFDGKTLGQVLADGFGELADALASDKATVAEKFTCHRISLDLNPTPYNPELVKSTRAILGASQAVFAKFIGVSVQTVRSWEQGANEPKDIACRLMDEIRHDPDYWRARMRDLAVKKTPRKPATT